MGSLVNTLVLFTSSRLWRFIYLFIFKMGHAYVVEDREKPVDVCREILRVGWWRLYILSHGHLSSVHHPVSTWDCFPSCWSPPHLHQPKAKDFWQIYSDRCIFMKLLKLGMVVHTCTPDQIREAEEEDHYEFEASRGYTGVQSQFELHRKTLSQKIKVS